MEPEHAHMQARCAASLALAKPSKQYCQDSCAKKLVRNIQFVVGDWHAYSYSILRHRFKFITCKKKKNPYVRPRMDPKLTSTTGDE